MNPINPAEHTVEKELINRIKALERQAEESKTSTQPIGAESLRIGKLPSSGPFHIGPINVGAGGSITQGFYFTPTANIPTINNLAFTAYIDAYDAAHAWPFGSAIQSLSVAANIFVTGHIDLALSDDSTNKRQAIVKLQNRDSVSHNVYIDIQFYLPLASGATGA